MEGYVMDTYFGIDFGTSNSALSVNIDGQVELLDIDEFNKDGITMKTVIYYDEDKRKFYLGQEAVNEYIDNDAYGRYIQSIKTYLKDDLFDSTSIGSKSYKLEDLVAIILRAIKLRGEAIIGKEVNKVVLGRPVIFSKNKNIDALAEGRLFAAAKIAGFTEIRMQMEPIAAAFAYEKVRKDPATKIILVGDFGGGTSDFAIIRSYGLSKKSGKGDVLSTGGVYVGGDIFDSQIMWEKLTRYFGRFVKLKTIKSIMDGGDEKVGMPLRLFRELCQWHKIPRLNTPKVLQDISSYKYLSSNDDERRLIENLENLITENYGYMLFRAIESAKLELSTSDDAEISFVERNLVINELMSRIDFEEIISSEVQKIKECVEIVLERAELKESDIDVVFLTGGSSYVPCIKNIFETMFQRSEITQADAFTSVAYGLGMSW